jgi:hypothetical protein
METEMNSQFSPGINAEFARQEHARLLKEAKKARMLHQSRANASVEDIPEKNTRAPSRKRWFLLRKLFALGG